MGLRYSTAIWFTLLLSVLLIPSAEIYLYGYALLTGKTVLCFSALLFVSATISVILRKYLSPPLVKRLGIAGGLMVPPFLLLLFSVPVAVTGVTPGSIWPPSPLNSERIVILIAATAYLSSYFSLSLASCTIIGQGIKGKEKELFRPLRITLAIFIFTAIVLLIMPVDTVIRIASGSWFVRLLATLALVQVLSLLVFTLALKKDLKKRLTTGRTDGVILYESENMGLFGGVDKGRLQSSLFFQSHYLDIISGKSEYLFSKADDNYAESLIQSAWRYFDMALMPSLEYISSEGRFRDTVRNEAAGLLATMNRYFSDPVTNREMLIQSGHSEVKVRARSLLAGGKTPGATEVMRLLHSGDTEMINTGLAAIGLFRMKELYNEVTRFLSVPETGKEAFFLLRHLGTEISDSLIMNCSDESVSAEVCILLSRLADKNNSPELVDRLITGLRRYPLNERLRVLRNLEHISHPVSNDAKKILTEMSLETISGISAVIGFQLAAAKSNYVLLEKALSWDREAASEFLFTCLSFLAGRDTVTLLRSYHKSKIADDCRLGAEIIRAVFSEPLRKPLLALLNNNSDTERIHDLSLLFHVKKITGSSLAHEILASGQNVTGNWSKACALRKITEGKETGIPEQIITFLFSNSMILLEESARALRKTDPGQMAKVLLRLPPEAANTIRPIFENTVPEAAGIFSKTRFLNLCFGPVPEERMLFVAERMKYSVVNDAGSLPGMLSWVVPYENERSGLYSLNVNVLTDFVFHYSEYTDIFVGYIDKREGDVTR